MVNGPLGTLFPRIGLPLITGYLFVGALAGPFMLDVIHKPDLKPLSLVTQFALAFISFSAGAELYLPELRSLFKRIMYTTTMIAIVTFTLCALLITAMASGGGIIPFMEELDLGCRMSVAAIAAAIMVARSPASAIAVCKELKAKGVFTSTVLGVTVAADIYVLVLFSLTTAVAESECKGEGFSATALGITVAVIVLSCAIGWVIGRILLCLMAFKRIPMKYLILPLGLGIFVFCHWFTDYSIANYPYVINLEPLLICIVGGYVCTNQSKHRHRFIGVLQQAGPYVFLPFFTLTGASLDLKVMLLSFGFAAITASLRAACIFVGSSAGGWMAGVKPYTNPANMQIWMCLLTQAGVSLGLASEVGMSFPEWGRAFQTAIIGVVLINQIIGPVLFKIAIRKMGDANKAGIDDVHDEDAVIPTAVVVGYTPTSMGIAVRLLSDHWNVTMVCANEKEASAAKSALQQYAADARAAVKAAKQTNNNGANATGSAAIDAMDKGLESIKDGMKSIVDVASKAATTAVNAATGGATTASPTTQQQHASGDEDEEDHHGHKKRKLEEGFTTVGLLPDDTPDAEHPFRTSDSASTAAAGGAAAGGTDHRFLKIVELVSKTRALAATVFALENDSANFGCAQVVDSVITAAPKKSSLHSVRLLVVLQSPGWAGAFENIGIIPVHPALHATHLAAKLVSAPRARPLTVLGPAANQDELCHNVAGLLQGPHFWKIAPVGAAAGGGEAVGPDEVTVHVPAAVSGTSSAADASKPAAATAGAGGSIMGALRNACAGGEEVGEWAGARDEYLDQLNGLENGEEQQESGSRNEAGAGAAGGRRKGGIEDVEMYGTIADAGDGEAEADDSSSKSRGLASKDTVSNGGAW